MLIAPATATRIADPAQAARLMRLATYASVAVAAVLIVAKAAAWELTDSVSVLSSLLDSLLDAAASLVNLLAVRHALTPADREHRFGHGKAEPLAGLAQAAFITGSALLLASEAAHRLFSPQPIAYGAIGIAAMVLSILATVGLVVFQRRVVAKTGSVAVGADSLHYASDFLLNGSVIVSILLTGWLGWQWIDPVFGIAIGMFILIGAWRIARLSFNLLMDIELPDSDRDRIRALALAHPEVTNVHDLRTRSAGPDIFIQMHLEMNGEMPLRRAHEVADQVESEILAAFPNAEVIIHQDPEGVAETRKSFAR
ncbi:MAG TPA: cation diffusion facilitator family transporter [Alphaproteobacteria bacterium]|nr:cation diffusion facilitator family transporter [Alphaproteobacteria bacterium]